MKRRFGDAGAGLVRGPEGNDHLRREFFSATPSLMLERLVIYGCVAAFLWVIRHPYLEPMNWQAILAIFTTMSRRAMKGLSFAFFVVVAAIIAFFRPRRIVSILGVPLWDAFDDSPQALAYRRRVVFLVLLAGAGFVAYLALPPLPKIAVLTLVLGEMLLKSLSSLLQVRPKPFLVIGQSGVAGRTRWGWQRTPWEQVDEITWLKHRSLLSKSEQLLISTRILTPPSWTDRLFSGRTSPQFVYFLVPSRNSRQIPDIVTTVELCRPGQEIWVEKSDSRPGWLRGGESED